MASVYLKPRYQASHLSFFKPTQSALACPLFVSLLHYDAHSPYVYLMLSPTKFALCQTYGLLLSLSLGLGHVNPVRMTAAMRQLPRKAYCPPSLPAIPSKTNHPVALCSNSSNAHYEASAATRRHATFSPAPKLQPSITGFLNGP